MKGDPKITRYLNQILKHELTAINQYFMHSRMSQNWGFDSLGSREYTKSIQDMKHADELIKRVLFIEGLPNLQDLGKLLLGEDVLEILNNDLAMQQEERKLLCEAIAHCESEEDFVSRDLLEKILGDEEEHIDWLEAQLGLAEQLGVENFLQSQM